jgi:hypothetical protein
MKKIILLLCAILALNTTSFSQDLDKLLNSGDDLGYLFKGYMNPFAEGMGKALNSGWYNTADVHDVLGFDITIGASLSMAPEEAKTFLIKNSDMSSLKLANGKSQDYAPTFYGEEKDGPNLNFKGLPDVINQSLTLPAGTGMEFAASIAPQIGIGIPWGTELQLRYFPTVSIGDMGEVGLWGFGIRHDLMQHIPIADKIPFVNLSLNLAYASIGSTIDVNAGSNVGNGDFETNVSSFTTNLCASVDIPFLTIYASAGYGTNNFDMKLKGKFTVYDTEKFNSLNPGDDIPPTTITDPLDESSSFSDMRFTGGMKLKFFLVHIFADYTVDGDYGVANLGMAISLR